MVQQQNKPQNWFFPSVTTKAEARTAAYQGFWAAILVGSITAVFTIIFMVLNVVSIQGV